MTQSRRETSVQEATSQELRKLYDQDYANDYEKKPMSRLIRLLPYMRLRPTDRVCDFGCGNGMLMELLFERVGTYVGVDFCDEMIASARLRQQRLHAENVNFYVEDIRKFCAGHRGDFDAAFAMDFSEHVSDSEWVEFLRAIRESLKGDGKLYLHTPDGDYFLEILKDIGVVAQFPQHIAVRNGRENEEILRRAGFSEINVQRLPHYDRRLSWLHPLRHIPGIGKYFSARLFIECS